MQENHNPNFRALLSEVSEIDHYCFIILASTALVSFNIYFYLLPSYFISINIIFNLNR